MDHLILVVDTKWGENLYNEKNEMEKVNFGDLPANWEDAEFAEEWEAAVEEVPQQQNSRIKTSKTNVRKNK